MVERMRKCDVGLVFSLGDWVVYVIVKGVKGVVVYEKFEDFLYVLEYNVFIDIWYYLEN